jgi:hypothetical protein
LAEQQTLNLRVDGSIPSRLTTLSRTKDAISNILPPFCPHFDPNAVYGDGEVHPFGCVRAERRKHMRVGEELTAHISLITGCSDTQISEVI